MKANNKNTSTTTLGQKIEAFEKSRAAEKTSKSASGYSASRVGYELLVAVTFFSIIGFALDKQLGTLPWITLSLFFLGFITGVYNAWRAMNVTSEKVGAIKEKYARMPKTAPPQKEPDEDDEGDSNKPFGAA